MRRSFCFLCAAVAAILCTGDLRAEEETSVRVMSFNIRYDNPGDGPDQWRFRRDGVAELIRAEQVDIVGCQEARRNQIADLEERLPEYSWYGVGRDDGREGGEFVPVFYRTDRFEVLDKKSFWVSEEPDQPGSRGWDAALPRVTTYLRLKDRRTGDTWSVFNTHFDHRGRRAREESAKLLRERISVAPAGDHIVLTGDFNCRSTDAPYETLTAAGDDLARLYDARTVSRTEHRGPNSTWNGFREIVPDRQIDFIFVGEQVAVLTHEILVARKNDRFLSDHLPVVVDLRADGEPE